MKINIQIEDASREELQRLFGGMPVVRIPDKIMSEERSRIDKPAPDIKTPPAPKPKPKPEAKKRKGNTGKGNPYGIPHQLFSQDKKKYQRLWYRCKTKGIKYEEALKLEKPSDAKEPVIKIEGADNLVDKMPEIRPPIREAHKRVHEAVTAANIRREPPAEFKVGVHVRQIKPYLDRKVSGIGVVTALVKGLVEVNFNGSQYYKIAPDCLEVL